MERDFKGVWIPKEIWLNKDLNCTEKLLLVEIDSLAKNGECFASNEHFAKFLRIGIRQVQNGLVKLKELGFISTFVIFKEGTKQVEKRIITPHAKKFMGSCIEVREVHEVNYTTPHEKKCMDNNTSITNTINNTISKTYKTTTGVMEKEFEQLWKIYPRKLGKKKAFDSYKKVRKIKKVPYETIESGLYRYIDYLKTQGTEEQYIQHGSTWFGQEKWQDEYLETHFQKKPQLSRFTEMCLNEMDNPDEFLNLIGVGESHEQRRNRKIINVCEG
jgi:Helix-turn-helix domain